MKIDPQVKTLKVYCTESNGYLTCKSEAHYWSRKYFLLWGRKVGRKLDVYGLVFNNEDKPCSLEFEVDKKSETYKMFKAEYKKAEAAHFYN